MNFVTGWAMVMSGASSLATHSRRRRELINWLRQQPGCRSLIGKDWRAVAAISFATTHCALCSLAKEGVWLGLSWREALQVWSE